MARDVDELVAQAKAGDKDAFGELYSQFFDRIYRFVYVSVRDRELSEDLTQNTFLRCWRSMRTFTTSTGSFQAFLFAIARNLLIDWYRKKKPLPLFVAEQKPSKENLEENAIRKEAQGVVWKALFRLRKLERHLIVLRYFEELPYKEIAKVVGKNEGAVRVSIYRILKTLKGQLNEDL
jgi:RNA polymerase sigma-70 factor (ECF subfamily)